VSYRVAMSSDSPHRKPLTGDVESVTRIDGDKGKDNGIIEVRLVDHPHVYRVRVKLGRGAPRLIELHLVPAKDTVAEIDTDTVRTVPVRRLTNAAARHISIDELPFDVAGQSDDLTAQLRPDHTRGRQLDDVHYRDVAQMLNFAHECGLAPREYVRQKFNTSVPSVDRWIAEAKKRGFLDPDWSNNNGHNVT